MYQILLGFVMNRYFRSGAPPVINPLLTSFPRDTVVPGSFAVTLTWTLPNRTTGAFNVTSPLPGDWFLAAHLPKDEGKISVKVGSPLRCSFSMLLNVTRGVWLLPTAIAHFWHPCPGGYLSRTEVNLFKFLSLTGITSRLLIYSPLVRLLSFTFEHHRGNSDYATSPLFFSTK